jgi:hypothetical protein
MRFPIAVTDLAPAIPTAPGGTLVLHGQWTFAARDLVIDACQSGHSAGAATGAGAFDFAAGGWQLQARDWASHTCRLVATGQPALACSQSGVTSPCLPSRLRSVANGLDIPMSVAELQQGLVGGLEAEVLTPEAAAITAPPVPPSWLAMHTVELGAGMVSLAVFAVAVRGLVRRSKTPEAMVRRVASRVRSRLGSSDPVYKRLAPAVTDLARQADELVDVRDRLSAKVKRADRDALVRRRDELASRAKASSEAADAKRLVDEQIARVDRWQGESERASDRLDRVLEYLRALDTRIDDAGDRDAERTGVRVEEDARLLKELERDVESALQGAREADRLVPNARG